MEKLHDLLSPAMAVARAAGEVILEVYETDFKVRSKDDNTPLTRADMGAHTTIEAGLTALTPDWPILSEEDAGVPFATRRTWQRYWLVDPLDGTREFVKRNDQFSVNVALIDNGQPILGIIYAPVTRTIWFAASGLGAWRQQGRQEPAVQLTCRQAAAVPVVAASRSAPGPRTRQYLADLGPHEIIRQGSAIKFGLIAEGTADVYIRYGLTSEWDTAAGQCLVEEAGGQVTDVRMRPLRYNTKKSLLNPDFFAFGDARRDWSGVLVDRVG